MLLLKREKNFKKKDIKREKNTRLLSPPHKDTVRSQLSQPSLKTELAGTLILDFPATRTDSIFSSKGLSPRVYRGDLKRGEKKT